MDLALGTSCCRSHSGYFTLSKPPKFFVFYTVYLSALSPKGGKWRVPRPGSMWEDVVRQKFKIITGSGCVSTRRGLVCTHQQTLSGSRLMMYSFDALRRLASTWIGYLQLFSLETNKIRWGRGGGWGLPVLSLTSITFTVFLCTGKRCCYGDCKDKVKIFLQRRMFLCLRSPPYLHLHNW